MIAPSGPVSTDDILTELRKANPNRNYPISTTDADVLALAGKSPGQTVKIPDDFWGKSAVGLAVTATASGQFKNSASAAGTVSGTATATVTGSTGTTQYQWVVLSNPGGATVSGLTSQQMGASKAYARYATGSADVQVRCDVTDGSGKTVSSNVVTIPLGWEYVV